MSQETARRRRVVVVGSLNVDLTVRVPALPAPGETMLGSDLATAPGGKGANQAVAARRLGADVAMIGCVGRDTFGDLLLGVLEGVGVDTSGVRRVDAPTGVALITTDAAGENTIALAPGANRRLSASDVEAARAPIEAAEVCVAQLEVPVEAVAAAYRIARAAGATTLLNVAPSAPVPSALWQATTVAVLNEVELAQATSRVIGDEAAVVDAARELGGRGPRVVVVTRGAAPTLALAVGGEPRWVAPPSIRPIDTVGAGDAFVGALAVELNDLSALGLVGAVAFANAAGALAATERGAQPAGLSRAAVARLLDFGRA